MPEEIFVDGIRVKDMPLADMSNPIKQSKKIPLENGESTTPEQIGIQIASKIKKGDKGDKGDTGSYTPLFTNSVMSAPTSDRIYQAMGSGTFSNLKKADGTAAPGISVTESEIDPFGLYDRVEFRYNTITDTWTKVLVAKNKGLDGANGVSTHYVDYEKMYINRSMDYGVFLNYDFPNLTDRERLVNLTGTANTGINSLLFDGTKYVNTGNIPTKIKHTYSFGVKLKIGELNRAQHIVKISNPSDYDQQVFAIYLTAENQVSVVIWQGVPDSSKMIHITVANPISKAVGDNLSIVVVKNAYYLDIFIDGLRQPNNIHTLALANKMPSVINMCLGAFRAGESSYVNYFNGEIYDAVLWDRQISDARVSEWLATGNTKTVPKIIDKIAPQEGFTILKPSQIATKAPGINTINEGSIVYYKGKWLFYSSWANVAGDGSVTEWGIGLCYSARPDTKDWQVHGFVAGGSAAKAGLAKCCGSQATIGDDGYLYLFVSIDYLTPGNGSKILRSEDGFNFTLMGDAMPNISTQTHANWSVWGEKQADGYYYGITEDRVYPNGDWFLKLVRSTSLATTFEFVEDLPAFKFYAGTTIGGANLHRLSDRWLNFYHGTADHLLSTGVLPSRGLFAQNFNAVPNNSAWTGKQFPTLDMTDIPEGAVIVDQYADTFWFEWDGRTYAICCVMQNAPAVLGEIRMFVYDGTLYELIK